MTRLRGTAARVARTAARVVRSVARLGGPLTGDRAVVAGERLVLALIVVNTTAVVLGTVDSLAARYGAVFDTVEFVAVAAFTVEFIVRVAVRIYKRRDEWPGLADAYLVVDLLAILPYYVGLSTGVRGLRSSSLLRVLRLFKFARYVDGVEALARVIRRKQVDLAVSALGTGLLWLVAASAIYFAERGAQPVAFSSIPASLWWAGTTITTVGYGDVYPVTPIGKLLGVVVSLLGVGVAAVPSTIIVRGMLEEIGPDRDRCPHCGRRIDE